MANVPGNLRYTKEHEYVRFTDSSTVEIGITDFAQGELGDVVYVELPKVGSTIAHHDVFGSIEAVKAVSELFSPLSGEVVEVNARLDKEPALVNSDPYGAGWMIRMKMKNPGEADALLNADQYSEFIRSTR